MKSRYFGEACKSGILLKTILLTNGFISHYYLPETNNKLLKKLIRSILSEKLPIRSGSALNISASISYL